MTKSYRAFISMPIAADTDEEALDLAGRHANSLLHPGSTVIGGHVELLTEVASGGGYTPTRVVFEDQRFWDQIP
jgi:hypothetical protein